MQTSQVQTPTTFAAAPNDGLSQVDVEALRAEIERSGAVLLRGFATTLSDFAGLGDALCTSSLFNESPNRAVLEDGARVQSVNLGSDPFPLHSELAREPWRPDLAMFTCLEPPQVGGQTNLCDGIAIVDALPPDIRSSMAERKILYIRPASAAALRYWLGTDQPSDAQLQSPPSSCPYWFRRVRGMVVRGFIRPLLEPTLFQQRPAFANFILFARDYLRINNVPLLDDGTPLPDEWVDAVRSAARKLTYAHAWQSGDVLILDNSRYMHGRRAIADAAERRIATYFGFLRGVVQRPGEPEDPMWRRSAFVPPEAQDAM